MKSILFYENQVNVKILFYNFTWAKFRSFYTKPRKLIYEEFNFYFSVFERRRRKKFFSSKLDDIISFIFIAFYNTTRFKISSDVLDFDTLRTRCHFAFCLQMFTLRNSEKSNFPSAKINLKSSLPSFSSFNVKCFGFVLIAF